MAQRTDIRYVKYYTDGSAARKLKPAVILETLKTIKLPKVKKQKKLTIAVDPVAFAALGMAVMMTVLIAFGMVQLRATQAQVQTMTAYVSDLQDDNIILQEQYVQKCDLKDIEKTALALGMVPKAQVEHVSVRLPESVTPEEPTAWERFTTFLTGLFA